MDSIMARAGLLAIALFGSMATPVITSISLTGAGDGAMFFFEVQAAESVDVDGGLVASTLQTNAFIASTAEELTTFVEAASQNPTAQIADVLLAGADKGRRVMCVVVKGTVVTSGGGGDDHKVLVSISDSIAGFLGDKLIPDPTTITVTLLNPGGFEQLQLAVNLPGVVSAIFPVPDNVFAVRNVVDPTKFLNVDLSGQTTGTLQTIVTTATISRPFRLPDISGTAVVQEDVSGQVFMGIGVTGTLHGSNAGVQYSSTTANRGSYRANQYGNNAGVPGLTGFKSRGATIGSLAGCLPGDVLCRVTAVGVCPDNVSIPLAGLASFVVPAAFVPAGQDFLPTDYEVETQSLLGPINGHRVVFKATSEGEAQTLRGVRAGGISTAPSTLASGALISSSPIANNPNGIITGNPGDVYIDQQAAFTYGAAIYVKGGTAGTNTDWILITPNETTTAGFVAPILNGFAPVGVRDATQIRVDDYISIGKYGAFRVAAKFGNVLTIHNDGRATQGFTFVPEPAGLQVLMCPKPQQRIIGSAVSGISPGAGIDIGPFSMDVSEQCFIQAELQDPGTLTGPQVLVEGFLVAGAVSYHRFINPGDPNNTVRVHVQNNSADDCGVRIQVLAQLI